MMNARHLRRLFQGILAATVAPGCTSGIDTSNFDSRVCPQAETALFQQITPATPADYVELRGADMGATTFTSMAKMGEVCKTATMSACMDTFNAVALETGWNTSEGFGIASYSYLVYTRGEDVGTVDSLDSLKQFLAPIDNEYEAAFMMKATLPHHRFVCRDGENNARPADEGGFDFVTESGTTCGGNIDEHIVHVTEAGEVTVTETVLVEEGDSGCAIGRRPEGLAVASRSAASDRVGAFFAEVARLEAASVHAFERFERELRMHGAPRTLVRDARRARGDEVRHARMTRRLARRNGATPLSPRVRRMPERSLFAFAKENAIEGCIRETFGALVAMYQAKHATDTEIAQAMDVIAKDETRHASLAWRTSHWVADKLSADERAEIAKLQRAAVRQLERTIAAKNEPDPRAGLPGRTASLRLLRGLSHALGLAAA